MGTFSGKFVLAAKQAAEVMRGTLYETYYEIQFADVQRLPSGEKKESRWSLFTWPPKLDDFATLCCTRAGVTYGGWDPATNGMIIEQQQIVTTQNLAPLFAGLGLAEILRPHLADMARRCFGWICRRLQVKEADWHARLITVKNTAYAWRQMLFYLSFISAGEFTDFVAWATSHLATQPSDFQVRFRPAFEGLLASSVGRSAHRLDDTCGAGRKFLGWSKSRHWLLG